MSLPSRDEIAKRLDDTLNAMVAGTFGSVADPAADVKPHLDEIIAKREYTVRDGMLTLLAMEVEHGKVIDWATQPLHNPARSASRYLGSVIYPRLNIAGSREALQSGVKGVGRYIDRGNAPWKAVLEWASRSEFDPERVLEDVAREYGLTADEVRRGTRADAAEARFVVSHAGAGGVLATAEVEPRRGTVVAERSGGVVQHRQRRAAGRSGRVRCHAYRDRLPIPRGRRSDHGSELARHAVP